jgi:GDP-L-fucose synthase
VNIVVTGATGFLGRHLMDRLPGAYGVSSRVYDLRQVDHVDALFKHTGQPDILFHLAARVGGIGANRARPGQFFYDNMLMGLNVIHKAMEIGAGKVIMVGTTCSYPKYTPVPFDTLNLFDGYPEETNAPIGISKRALYTMLKAYQDQYRLKFVYLIPTNLYGPGDNFNDGSSHVIPSLIKKCLQAKEEGLDEVKAWGTGKPTRDFVYVEDVADALVLAMEHKKSVPLNLGSGRETSISDLTWLIKETVGYTGRIKFDKSKPDGQPRRLLDTDRTRILLGWQATTPLEKGLQKTVEWYRG